MNAFIEKWNTISASQRPVATGSPIARPCASCGSTTLRAEGNLWVCDRCTPESAQVQVSEADAFLARAVQVLNRAGAHINVGNGRTTITLPQQRDNSLTRQAVRTLYGDTCEVVRDSSPGRRERWIPWPKWYAKLPLEAFLRDPDRNSPKGYL
jgi:ribosomal protein L37AE/L43A